jgi:hypothetical protein
LKWGRIFAGNLGGIGWAALTAAAAIIAFQVVVPPAIGLADNADFAKIAGRFDLHPPGDEELRDYAFRYIHIHYQIEPASRWETGFHSSESMLAGAAMVLNGIASGAGDFDIRWLGIVHACVFLLAFGLFVPLLRGVRTGPRIGLLALAVLIFCDVVYSAFYNSFFMDAGALVFLLLSIALLMRAVRDGWRRSGLAWLALAACLLLVTAKSQHALLGIPLAAFFLWQRDSLWPRRAIVCSATAACLLAAGAAYALAEGSPAGYTNPCLFDIIFARLLPGAKDPAAELASLGLDRSYLRYSGMDAYMDVSPMRDRQWVRTFRSRTSFPRLVWFYATHPVRTFDVSKLALSEAALQRPATIGNYDRSAGRPPHAQSGAFSAWSTVRRKAVGASVWVYALIFAAALGIVTWRYPAGGFTLGLMALIEFGLGALTDALEVARHLFLFNTIWDATFLAAVCVVVLGLEARWGPGRRAETKQPEPVEMAEPAACLRG